MSDLLNGVLHFVLTMLLKEWEKEKRRRCISEKKTEEKQNSVTIMMSIDAKGTVFPVRLKLEGKSFEWRY